MKIGDGFSSYTLNVHDTWMHLNNVFLINRELDRKLKQQGIENVSVYCVSPGWCKTNLHKNTNLPWYAYILAIPVAALFMKSAREVSDIYLI